jgi:hypothetical protein
MPGSDNVPHPTPFLPGLPRSSSTCILSVRFPASPNAPTENVFTMSDVISQTKTLLRSESLFASSPSVAQTLAAFFTKVDGTVPLPFSLENLHTDVNRSSAFVSSCPFNLNPDRFSHQRSSSNKMEASVDILRSQSFATTTRFSSDPYLNSHSYRLSNLSPTVAFLDEMNNDEKAALASVKLTSGAAGGGGLIALIAILSLCFVLYRTHKTAQNGKQISPDFDLPIEHSDEEESENEEEIFVDFEDCQDRTNSNALSESESENLVRGGNDLRMAFDGEESF